MDVEFSNESFLERFGPWAVVTGASGGIGAEFARYLGRLNFNVVLVSRSAKRLQVISDAIKDSDSGKGQGSETRIIEADLKEDAGWEKVVKETEDLDVGLLVNNAGVGKPGAFMYYPLDYHMELVGVNVRTVTALSYKFSERFIKQKKHGGIIFLSSVSKDPVAWLSSYSGSKAYNANLSVTLRHELKQYHINVLSVEPRAVETPMTRELWSKIGFALIQPKSVVEKAFAALQKNKMRVVVSASELDDDESQVEHVEKKLEGLTERAKKAWDPSLFKYKDNSKPDSISNGK